MLNVLVSSEPSCTGGFDGPGLCPNGNWQFPEREIEGLMEHSDFPQLTFKCCQKCFLDHHYHEF
jgi:hypothetical protein